MLPRRHGLALGVAQGEYERHRDRQEPPQDDEIHREKGHEEEPQLQPVNQKLHTASTPHRVGDQPLISLFPDRRRTLPGCDPSPARRSL